MFLFAIRCLHASKHQLNRGCPEGRWQWQPDTTETTASSRGKGQKGQEDGWQQQPAAARNVHPPTPPADHRLPCEAPPRHNTRGGLNPRLQRATGAVEATATGKETPLIPGTQPAAPVIWPTDVSGFLRGI